MHELAGQATGAAAEGSARTFEGEVSAIHTTLLGIGTEPLQDRDFLRKHGKNAGYGQTKTNQMSYICSTS